VVSIESYVDCAAQLTSRIVARPEGRSEARSHGDDVAGGLNKRQQRLLGREHGKVELGGDKLRRAVVVGVEKAGLGNTQAQAGRVM
jgi:hypothetical protein